MLGAEPRISVLLPIFNGERFLAGQLQSIRDQTFRDFELLLVDDGSSDASRDIALEAARDDNRIRICLTNGNLGQKARLKELIEASRAPLIAISDQDDIWHHQKLEYLATNIGNAALAFGRSELIDDRGTPINKTLLQANGTIPRGGDRLGLLFRPQVSGHSLLARRSILTASAFLSPEPYDWLLSLNAAFSHGIAYADRAVVYHRMHSGNSYNDAVVARLKPLRIRPRHIRKAIKRITGLRTRFVTGLNFLSQSEVVSPQARNEFARIAQQCTCAWFEEGRSDRLSVPALQRSILDTLEPFAGSRCDWRTAVGNVQKLTVLPFT